MATEIAGRRPLDVASEIVQLKGGILSRGAEHIIFQAEVAGVHPGVIIHNVSKAAGEALSSGSRKKVGPFGRGLAGFKALREAIEAKRTVIGG